MDAAFLHHSLWDRGAVEPVCKREYLHCTNVCIRINSPTRLTSIKPRIVCTYTILLHGVVIMHVHYVYTSTCVRRPSGYFYLQVHCNLEHSAYVRCASTPYNVYTYTYKLNLYYNIMATTQWSQSHVHHVNHMYIGVCS